MAQRKNNKAQQRIAHGKAVVARLDAEASEKRIVAEKQKQLRKLMAAAEKEEARRRAEEEFKAISKQSKGAKK